MSLVLGIDTGGTYTDGVIIDRAEKKIIAKAKSLTTREDLRIGITNCIKGMDFDRFSEINVVSLSTTLATNAIVEGRGCEVGLLMIGFAPSQPLPAAVIATIPGGHNVKGKEKEAFDEAAARAAIEEMRGKVDAIAISGYLSVRNPEHELAAQKLVREILDIPVVCGHHLTRSLGMHERTVTAILNARLMPIIKELLVSVKESLEERDIHATIMIVKGDGSLMGEKQAEEKPIETLLSGPASSIIGATFLAGEKDALVLDMGGTTTDIAILKNGVPRIDEEGAYVGGWRTRVEAAAICTYGLGGDSYIQMDMNRKIKVGPQRVWPFCVLSSRYPYLKEELQSIHIPHAYLLTNSQVTDCFMRLQEKGTVHLTKQEQDVLDILKDGPHSFAYIVRVLNKEMNLFDLSRLVNLGIVGRISVTPTDILHAKGLYDQWDVEGAKIAVDLLAARFPKDRETFIEWAIETITNALCYTCLQSLSTYDGNTFTLKEEAAASYLIGCQLEAKDSFMECIIRPKVPIIGIGAPVSAWLPLMAAKLQARLIIPENPEVANAVGSATGKIMETVKILVHPGEYGNGYVLHSSWEKRNFVHLEEAVAYAIAFAEEKATALARSNGAVNIELNTCHRDIYARASMIENDIYIESRIEVVATEKPEWEKAHTEGKFFADTRNRGLTLQG
jgi:N-methylhydantoinase A/oxoprolinase/acetone carboxylase beta subunit